MTVLSARVRYRDVLAVREFRWLYLAMTQSVIGDQIARVALSVLTYGRTGSDVATAAVYALTYLPELAGGLLLSGLADRWPRRSVLIGADAVRAVLIALTAIPALPLGAVGTLIALAVFAGSPFKAGEPALIADLFDDSRYPVAIGLRTATVQAAQIAGFAVGGMIVASIRPSGALALDAGTFALSALLLTFGLVPRPATLAQGSLGMQLRYGISLVARTPVLRVTLGLAALTGFWIVPEGLAAPYADAFGGRSGMVGLLLTAMPIGAALGAVLLSRLVPARQRPALVGPLTVAAGLPLVACAALRAPVWTFLLWLATGICTAYLVQLLSEYVLWVDPSARAQAMGLGSTVLLAAQGIGLALGGVLAQWWDVFVAVAAAGALGSGCALVLAAHRRRLSG